MLDGADRRSRGRNPLCGDDYDVTLKVGPDGRIEEAAFWGKGCAISKASASMMTVLVKGKTREEARALAGLFVDLVMKDMPPGPGKQSLGTLAAFEGVKKFPVRVKCATLSWRALEAALSADEKESEVSTE